ncbi:lamin tail domain-containing protein [Pelagicoccus sp. SDUM812002]|uniref:lamin tail domain-containing protein n=1 Tax=Pelagicoccus sp. SDUM812002 TaxID=3041266 RepID=UPI00280D2C97|nr:lamin tail domain-containing protein [Pelagicoccus sp. SDUM812002]MDQ8188215.1 lamin tail domain-containing protein [Pelagicoccus sp. SDUM812002]
MKNRIHFSNFRRCLLGTALLAATSAANGATVSALQESFETDGAGSRYLVENGADDGAADFFARRQEFSNGTVAAGGTIDGDWLFGARDIDNATNFTSSVQDLLAQEGRLTWSGIDISGLGNLQLTMAVAEGGEGFEPNNTLLIEIRVDSGEWINIGGFRSRGTNAPARYFVGGASTLTGVDSPRLVPEFVDFDWPINMSGSTLDLRVTFNSNADAEDYYLDNVRVTGDNAASFFGLNLEQETFQEPADSALETSLQIQLSTPAPAGGLEVSLGLTEIARNTVNLPDTLQVPAGQTSVALPFEIRQDGQFTGMKIIEVDFEAEGYSTERLRFRVENTTPQPRVVMMELLNVNPGVTELDLIGDSNGDGFRDGSGDDFVEIVNFEDYPVDISGWTISDDLGIRHQFEEGSVIGAGRAIVVFGGGNPTGVFGGATIQKSSSGLLAFNSNRPEIASLVARLGGLVETVDLLIDGDIYPVEPNGGSIHRSQGVAGADFTIHSQISGANNTLFSPGTLPNGQPYFTPENLLSISLSKTAIREDETGEATIATVSLESAAPAGGMLVNIESNGYTVDGDGAIVPDEITLESTTVMIPEGQSTATFPISGYDDELLDGVRDVRIVVRSGPDILPALAILKVEDIEPNPFNIVISEVMPMILGTGADINRNGVLEEAVGDKFIEFVNLSGFVTDMSGWQIRVSETAGASAPEIVHTFPEATYLNDQGALVVFGRVTEETLAARVSTFGNAVIQGAANPDGSVRANGLSIQRNQDTTIELLNAEGFQVAIAEYESDIGNQAMAITRAPELDGELTLHLEATQGEFIVYSPGLTFMGEAYAGNGDAEIPEEPVAEADEKQADAVSSKSKVAEPFTPARFVYAGAGGSVSATPSGSMVLGFELQGEQAVPVLLRAVSESSSDIDPRIDLYRQTEYGSYEPISSNDNWDLSLAPAMAELGASALVDSSMDAATQASLEPGIYTAVVSTQVGAGQVLGEIYLPSAGEGVHGLGNVSSLTRIDANGQPATLDFIADGGNNSRYMVRAIGPGLATWRVDPVAEDPELAVFDSAGVEIARNDDWQSGDFTWLSSDAAISPLVEGSADAAVYVESQDGAFSAEVEAQAGGSVLLELFDLGETSESLLQ